MSRPPSRISLHVGLPKTGTSFLQASLAQNRDALRAAGVRVPKDRDAIFRAVLEVREQYDGWGRTAEETRGAWGQLAHRMQRYDAGAVVSHELLASASSERIAWAVDTLGAALDTADGTSEIHVVVTARDPARQAIAEWQEGVKHGRRLSFERFTRKVLAADADTQHAERFRASQDLPAVLERWAGVVPPERVHVVTCPPRGTEPTVLWRRFAEAAGFDATDLEPAGKDQRNASLGVHEIDFLRRVNKALDGRLQQPAYGQVVKELLAQDLMARRTSSRPVAPAELVADLSVVAERWAKEIDAAGWTVHGDLADLAPQVAPGPHPDAVDRREELASAATMTADLLVALADDRARIGELEEEIARQRRKRDRLRKRLGNRLGHRLRSADLD